MNELYLNARIYLDTNKTNLFEAQNEFWDLLTGLNQRIEIEVDKSELRNGDTYEIIDK